jgi:hypothetical protein
MCKSVIKKKLSSQLCVEHIMPCCYNRKLVFTDMMQLACQAVLAS